MSKFIHQISRTITLEDLERLKPAILEPKMETTEYLNNLANLKDITTLPKFQFMKYQG